MKAILITIALMFTAPVVAGTVSDPFADYDNVGENTSWSCTGAVNEGIFEDYDS